MATFGSTNTASSLQLIAFKPIKNINIPRGPGHLVLSRTQNMSFDSKFWVGLKTDGFFSKPGFFRFHPQRIKFMFTGQKKILKILDFGVSLQVLENSTKHSVMMNYIPGENFNGFLDAIFRTTPHNMKKWCELIYMKMFVLYCVTKSDTFVVNKLHEMKEVRTESTERSKKCERAFNIVDIQQNASLKEALSFVINLCSPPYSSFNVSIFCTIYRDSITPFETECIFFMPIMASFMNDPWETPLFDH